MGSYLFGSVIVLALLLALRYRIGLPGDEGQGMGPGRQTMATGELPTFSIIIPTHSRPVQLASCLAAIARLDYPRDRVEVIVVDDGGKMPLSPVYEQPEGLTLKRIVQAHAGPAAARNKGVAHAGGQFVAFTDDDCEPAPDWLNALSKRLMSEPNRAVGGRTINALPENPYSAASEELLAYLYTHLNFDAERARFLASNNLAVPAQRFREMGGFDERFALPAGEDRDFCDRWRASGYPLTYAPEAIVCHAHRLSLRGFISQQFNYGRGAFYFHSTRARRTGRQGSGEPLRFYLQLLIHPFAVPSRRHAVLQQAFLFALSQAAIAAGCGWAALFDHRSNSQQPTETSHG
jgi:GT2 family glycosyltransferase